MIGALLDGRYKLVRRLGEGGMGTVYRAVHVRTGRSVAVKVLAKPDFDADQEVVERFQREAHAAGRIESQHIAQVFDAGRDRDRGLPFIAMELLIGCDLRQLLAEAGPLPVDLALRIGAQACLGLQRAHDAGIVHRDIKPANLFLAHQRDGEMVVKLLDFGIAKLPIEVTAHGDAAVVTMTGRLLGSPLFMSPEQAQGLKTLDHRTDLWSLGAVLYEAISGRTPLAQFENVGQLIVALCSRPAPDLREVAPWAPLEVAEVIRRALSIDPCDRPASASAFYEDLCALLPNGTRIGEDDWDRLGSGGAGGTQRSAILKAREGLDGSVPGAPLFLTLQALREMGRDSDDLAQTPPDGPMPPFVPADSNLGVAHPRESPPGGPSTPVFTSFSLREPSDGGTLPSAAFTPITPAPDAASASSLAASFTRPSDEVRKGSAWSGTGNGWPSPHPRALLAALALGAGLGLIGLWQERGDHAPPARSGTSASPPPAPLPLAPIAGTTGLASRVDAGPLAAPTALEPVPVGPAATGALPDPGRSPANHEPPRGGSSAGTSGPHKGRATSERPSLGLSPSDDRSSRSSSADAPSPAGEDLRPPAPRPPTTATGPGRFSTLNTEFK